MAQLNTHMHPTSISKHTSRIQRIPGWPVSRGAQQGLRVRAAAFDPPATTIVRKSPSVWDVMRFNGAAPELVNGRLAMVGLLTAAHTEMATGQTVMQQFASAPVWQYLAFGVIVYASLVPMMKGARHEAFGWFTPRAEYTNARAAMLGFGVLLALENYAQVPFF